MRELKINSRIRKILNQSETEQDNSKILMKSLAKDLRKDSKKDYLRQFLQISFGDVHESVKSTKNKELTVDAIIDGFRHAFFEENEEGKLITKNFMNKDPFKRQTTLLSRSSSFQS